MSQRAIFSSSPWPSDVNLDRVVSGEKLEYILLQT
jgi:hypothetical protein